jgi:hypothetical protein
MRFVSSSSRCLDADSVDENKAGLRITPQFPPPLHALSNSISRGPLGRGATILSDLGGGRGCDSGGDGVDAAHADPQEQTRHSLRPRREGATPAVDYQHSEGSTESLYS